MFVEGKGTWTLLVHRASGPMLEVDRWLRLAGLTDIAVGSGASPRVLRARFTGIPAGWSEILRAVTVRFMQIAPSGIASLFYEDDELAIRLLVHEMRRGAVAVHDRPTRTGERVGRLTRPQYDALSLAVGLGYYESPPRADQQEIAVHLGVSRFQLSELLDEGESAVVTAHIDSIMMTRMSDASFEGDAGPGPLPAAARTTDHDDEQ